MKSIVACIALVCALTTQAKILVISNQGDFGNQTAAITDYIIDTYSGDFDETISYTGTNGFYGKIGELGAKGEEYVALKIETENSLKLVTTCKIKLNYTRSTAFSSSSSSLTRTKVATVFRKSKRADLCREYEIDEINNFLETNM